MLVTLFYVNPTANIPIQVYLTGSIRKDDNSISIQLKDNYRPGIPIVLMPSMPKTLTGGQLQNVFGNGTLNDLMLNGITTNGIITNQALPEGNYSICIKVKEYNSGRLLSEDCRSIFITHGEPPQITFPLNNSVETEKTPQNVMISWLPTTPFVQGLSYRLRVVKLMNGISPYDAINYSTQVLLEKSNIITTNYRLDLASGIKLDTGSMYVAQVTAQSPTAYIKNSGRSEPVLFLYRGAKPLNEPLRKQITDSKFVFLNPISRKDNKTDTVKVNNENDMLINWCWVKNITSDSSVVNDLEVINDSHLDKYVLKFKKKESASGKSGTDNQIFTFSRTFQKSGTTGLFENSLQLNENQTIDAGFEDGAKYQATMDVYDTHNELVIEKTSPTFVFRRIKDEEPTLKIPFQAVVKYGFENYPEIHSVENTEVTIEAFKIQDQQTAIKPFENNENIYLNNLPSEKINGINYVNIASKVVTTDDKGSISARIPVPKKYFERGSILYRLKINNRFYVDKDFASITVPVDKKDSFNVNFGQLLAKTYAYSLKLEVKKNFPNYTLTRDQFGLKVELGNGASSSASNNKMDDKNQSNTYWVGKDTIAEGITVVLYRVDKPGQVPFYEGDITQKPAFINQSRATIVAMGVTKREGNSTYVTFNRLLSSDFNGEKYHIRAIQNMKELLKEYASVLEQGRESIGKVSEMKKSQTVGKLTYTDKTDKLAYELVQKTNQQSQGTFTNSGQTNNPIVKVDQNAIQTQEAFAYTGQTINPVVQAVQCALQIGSTNAFLGKDGFEAPDITFGLPLPNGKDKIAGNPYYRNVELKYNITSCKPPTSIIKGRLLYTWKSDISNLKRPLANTHFRVIVDYVDGDNNTVGATRNTGLLINQMGGSWESTTFSPDNAGPDDKPIPLIDQYATMAEGTTDSDGNFNIEVVNLNVKGPLGSGTLEDTSGSSNAPTAYQSIQDKVEEKRTGEDKINPGDLFNKQFDFGISSKGVKQNTNLQNSINVKFGITLGKEASTYEVNKVNKVNKNKTTFTNTIGYISNEDYGHGPCPQPAPAIDEATESDYKETKYPEFKRIFRIVIDGDKSSYYYPSKDIVKIQPFENMQTPVDITHYVREFKLKATTFEIVDKKESPVRQVQVTLFRDINSKPNYLPQGEGDGKYTYGALLKPEYSGDKMNIEFNTPHFGQNADGQEKYEQLWANKEVTEDTTMLTGLLQSEFKNYFIKSSSIVDKSEVAFSSSIEHVKPFEDNTTNWADPKIPVVQLPIELKPLISRALITIKDAKSGDNLTNKQCAKAIISATEKMPTNGDTLNSKMADQYGYIEMRTDALPLKNLVKPGNNVQNRKKIYFFPTANGYDTPAEGSIASFYYEGYQSRQIHNLTPSGTISGVVKNADAVKDDHIGSMFPGVESYLRIDELSKVYDTDEHGHFEIPITPTAGTKLKIIPKNVAWFDTAYVLTASNANQKNIKIGEINVYERRHRIQFVVLQKMSNGFTGTSTPVKGATIKMGDLVMTTAANGIAKFNFENVSVNNYSFVIKGPEGQGYIPKIKNLLNKETKEFVTEYIELEKGSEVKGTVTLDGKAVKNARVYLEISNTSTPQPNNSYGNTQVNIAQALSPQTGLSANQNPNLGNYHVANDGSFVQPTGTLTQDANLIVARTDANGKYWLRGIPVNNQTVNIIATLDTTFTVSGDKQQAKLYNGTATTDLNLKSFGGGLINKLYGFPLTVESINPVSSNQVRVTGLVNWMESISDFKLIDGNKALRVENVLYDLSEINHVKTAVAHENVTLIPGITDLKFSYIDKYNVKLTTANGGGGFNTKSLALEKENDQGKISGKLQITDNSFNYPSSYLSFTGSEFFLAKLNPDSTINNKVSIATSAFSETESLESKHSNTADYSKSIMKKISQNEATQKPTYHICDANGGPITFNLIGFPATAAPSKSYIDIDGKIHLNTSLKCYIPHAMPENFSLSIPDVVLDQNKVDKSSSSEPIKVKLEDWTLEVKNWEFSTEEGGILSEDATIKTKIIDIPMGRFVLRKDMFFMDKPKMDKLSMGGGKFTIEGVDTTKASLIYENKVGSKMTPHWNFCLLGNGDKKVASMPSLTGLSNYTVDLNYIQILSNNEMIVQLMQKKDKAQLMGNTLANFEPLTIYNGPDYVSVSGLLNVGAKRIPDIDLRAVWKYPTDTPTFENVSTDFEAKGFVHFDVLNDSIDITNTEVKIKGRVIEKPNKTFNALPATFYARTNQNPKYEVSLQKDWISQLSKVEPDYISVPETSKEGYNLKITGGGMSVIGDDWTTLKYTGLMRPNSGKSDDVKDNITSFEVLGDIKANSDSLQVTGVNTAFGAMTQTYDFKNTRLIGSLTIKSELTLGTLRIHKGTIETCFEPDGFYVAGGVSAFVPLGPLAGDYNVGFMLGSHKLDDHLWSVTNSYINSAVINTCYKIATPRLSGVYTACNREIINVNVSQNYILVSGYLNALALVGGDFYANVENNGWKVGGQGYFRFDLDAGLSAITGTSITGGFHAGGKVEFKVSNAGFDIGINANLGFNATVSQSLLFTTLEASKKVDCSIIMGTNKFDFNLNSVTDGVEKCE